jgi:hypothetical protein
VVDARHSATPLATFSFPSSVLYRSLKSTPSQGAMDPSTESDGGFEQPAVIDIDMLVNAALCARTGTYVYPLNQTMCDNG